MKAAIILTHFDTAPTKRIVVSPGRNVAISTVIKESERLPNIVHECVCECGCFRVSVCDCEGPVMTWSHCQRFGLLVPTTTGYSSNQQVLFTPCLISSSIVKYLQRQLAQIVFQILMT